MIKVGVTGAIGSGKTTLCKIWQQHGARVFFADDEAKKLMNSDEALKKRLKSVFGNQTYHADGSLNKHHLIHEAFQKGRVEELNRIVHPAVAKEFRRVCKNAEKEGAAMVVKEAALLLNNGRPEELDLIVIVKSDRSDRITRVVGRDQTNAESVLEREKNQPDFQKLEHLADYVIENKGSLEELQQKAKELFVSIIKEA